MGKRARVMVVEDSPTVRTLLCHIIDQDERLQLAAVCTSAEEALASIATVNPDVVSMDVRLPGMDGLEATSRIMADHPTPIVVIADSVHDSTLGIAMNALKAGALSVVEKPAGPDAQSYSALAETIATQLSIMSEVPVIRRRVTKPRAAPTRRSMENGGEYAAPRVLAIAASTGGPPALATLLGALPRDFPLPVLVVQHMGTAFMDGFAHWLSAQTKLEVRIAKHGETPLAGTVYVAPGGRHLTLTDQFTLRLSDEPPLMSQRPAATLLLSSIARALGPSAIGIVLTGMGEDGARGLLEMRQAGACTIAEDRSTAVVYGMPAVAAQIGAARMILPLDFIAAKVLQLTEGVQ